MVTAEENLTKESLSRLSGELIRRLWELPLKTALGLLRGFDKAVVVAERHDVDRGSKWLEQRSETHINHAVNHLAYEEDDSTWHIEPQDLDDDGLPHLDHAACRLLFAIAKREGM